MRLLHTQTLELHEFHGSKIPKYVILSHRWGDDEEEVSFKDLELGRAESRPIGWAKIRKCCEIAAAKRHKYVWIDTCCIDKTSSAELSEAVNSMFKWYERAYICYVYMRDVTYTPLGIKEAFKASEWFTRGWTLQELIAPVEHIFYDCMWTPFGPTERWRTSILEITGIDLEMVRLRILSEFSVAERMSWASKRRTTREEDIAYSLMGLFEVNMPLIYGEGGKRAFMRLQLEILRASDDESIFAWFDEGKKSGLLASSPSDFELSYEVRVHNYMKREHYSMTNKGLLIQLRLLPYYPAGRSGPKYWVTPLNCSWKSPGTSMKSTPLVVFLVQQGTSNDTAAEGENKWLRVGPLSTWTDQAFHNFELTHVYVQQVSPANGIGFGCDGYHRDFNSSKITSQNLENCWDIDWESLVHVEDRNRESKLTQNMEWLPEG